MVSTLPEVTRRKRPALPAGSLIALALIAGCAARPAPIQPGATPTPAAPPVTETAPAPAPTPVPTATAQPVAASLEGQWEGALEVSGASLKMVFHFTGSGAGLKGSLDVPQQSAKGIPLDAIRFNPPDLHFEAFSGARLAVYDGALQANGVISGTFTQAGFTLALLLHHVEVQATPPPPYRTEEVVFTSTQATLAGTLSLPDGAGPHPAIVLITGSGPQDRDEDVAGFPVFGVLADHLTRHGIAVLRYDDRGVGGSTGDVTRATSADLAGDVQAAIALLQTHPGIDPARIGLLGHSEGGLIAPMVVSGTTGVAFVVLMAGPGLSGEEVLRGQIAAILQAEGAGQSQIDDALAEQQMVFSAVHTGNGWDELKAAWRQRIKAAVDAMTGDQRKQLGDIDAYVDRAVQAQVDSVNTPWFRFFLTYDPAPALRALRLPVLALFGERDTQVLPDPNRQAVEKALREGGNADYTLQVVPKANHLFQAANTGAPGEYASLPREFAPGFLDTLTDWLLRKAGR